MQERHPVAFPNQHFLTYLQKLVKVLKEEALNSSRTIAADLVQDEEEESQQEVEVEDEFVHVSTVMEEEKKEYDPEKRSPSMMLETLKKKREQRD